MLLTCSFLIRQVLAHASIDYPPCIGMATNGTRFPEARNGSSTLPGDLVLTGYALDNARSIFNHPLAPNGTDFPCKFLNGVYLLAFGKAALTRDSFTESGNVAAHGGGSCQVSLSFDGGNNFQVIRSWVGGCPGNATWNENYLPPRDISPQKFYFKIPDDTPNGHAIFAWSWFPISGVTAMHMNCAWVNISNGSNTNHNLNPTDYPPLFVANVEKINTCKGKDGTEVVFPTPGKDATTATGTQTATGYPASTVTGNCTGIAQVTATATPFSPTLTAATSSPAKPTSSGGAAPLDVQQAWRRVSSSHKITLRLNTR
ncbi:hypothetical protein FGG08_000455 [Glutinoglossum americanum]|uniref:Lytic polysaccharide monooxygenase n=1 Tax=Glutinoglossum americanum TaxID=1670608 RepID=A0A9P8I929_9PEZI|nr:hypothetical protein FGG08_000455 [Glutinoglossum americanum]